MSLKTRIQTIRRRRGRRVKTPTVLQMEAVECGAAALGIVLAHFGCHVPLEELRIQCGVSRDGSKASNILRAARGYGLNCKGYRCEPAELEQYELPMIVHWNFNHFLVLEGIRGDTVYLNDPASGPRTVSREEFDLSFTGVVLVFEVTESFERRGKENTLLEALYRRLQGSERALGYVVLASLGLLGPGLLVPALSQIFVDYYLVQGMTRWVWPLLLGLALTAVMRAALTALQRRYLLRLESKLAIVNATALVWHVLRLPMEFFTQRSPGDIVTRIGLNDRVAQLLSGELASTILNVILVVFYGALMIGYSVPLTLVGIGMAALNFAILRFVSRQRVDANQKLIQENSKLSGTAYSGLQSIETLKATGAESDFFNRWAGYQAKVFNVSQELAVTNQALVTIPSFLTTMTNIAVLTLGGWQIMRGELTVGTLVAFQSLMASFLGPVKGLVNLGGQLQEMEGTINRLDDIHNYEPDPQVTLLEESVDLHTPRLRGAVEVRDLTFGYSQLAKALIEGFDLALEPGTRVALVGGSGSGKSTIARVIAGLYQPWSGHVLFDGRPRTEWPRSLLNHSLSMVNQEIFLFEGTVRENLTMWDDTIPEAQIVQAARDACIHDVIASRPGSYDAPVREGGQNFSGGQRQRLEIARALVTNPSILILDEATSALDPITEKEIDDNLRRRGCTCIIVAHRLSTIRDCDEIVVLDQGRVVERGTHESLWRSNGHYTNLIRAEAEESEYLLDSILETIAP